MLNFCAFDEDATYPWKAFKGYRKSRAMITHWLRERFRFFLGSRFES